MVSSLEIWWTDIAGSLHKVLLCYSSLLFGGIIFLSAMPYTFKTRKSLIILLLVFKFSSLFHDKAVVCSEWVCVVSCNNVPVCDIWHLRTTTQYTWLWKHLSLYLIWILLYASSYLLPIYLPQLDSTSIH